MPGWPLLPVPLTLVEPPWMTVVSGESKSLTIRGKLLPELT